MNYRNTLIYNTFKQTIYLTCTCLINATVTLIH